jgi:hypothetical protein
MNIKSYKWPRFLLDTENLGLKSPEEVISEYKPVSKNAGYEFSNTLELDNWDQWASEISPEVYRDTFFYP